MCIQMHNVKDYFVNLDAQRGLRIRQERDKRGWSQQEAADAVGIRREMWAKYEAGAEPGAKALTGMAAVQVDVLYILTGITSDAQGRLAMLERGLQTAADNFDSFEDIKRVGTALMSQMEAQSPRMTPRERKLLDHYRTADEAGKKIIEGTASFAAKPRAAQGGK